MTKEYRESTHRPPCPHCKASPKWQEVRNYMEVWNDGVIHCSWCDSYLWMYDFTEKMRLAH